MLRTIIDDITKIEVDAIVNAANSSLLGGGGVDGAIHRAGGPQILAECRVIKEKQGECEPGNAVITAGGNLPARYVIHAVGPIWHGGDKKEDALLANAYINSLKIAMNYSIKSIAFPNISTGVYGFPKERAAKIAINSVSDFISSQHTIMEILFVCFDEENYEIYKQMI